MNANHIPAIRASQSTILGGLLPWSLPHCRPVAALANPLHLGRRLASRPAKSPEEVIRHVGGDSVAQRTFAARVCRQEGLNMIGGSRRLRQCGHDHREVTPGMTFDRLQESPTKPTYPPQHSGRSRAVTASHTSKVACSTEELNGHAAFSLTRQTSLHRKPGQLSIGMVLGWKVILDVLYPPSCLNCGAQTSDPDLCTSCRSSAPLIREPLCIACGIPFQTASGPSHPCGRCLRDKPRFRRARACTTYATSERRTGAIAALVQRYKYNRDVSLAAALGRFLLDNSPLNVADYDVIVPVPLHQERLRWRGFNQALLLARRLARATKTTVDPFVLERVRPTPPQVELDETQRLRNVRNAFRVSRPECLKDRTVLLIDDVMTTGATADECSQTLKAAGARHVDVLVLARVLLQ